jgi:hypothetical protein
MILVPRQLARAGMTGNVPYYGGRFTPAQAYAASRQQRPHAQQLGALQHLRDTGVLSDEEFETLRSRIEQ